MNDIESTLTTVADELGWLADEPVFIGGATLALFVDEFGASQLRPTLDIESCRLVDSRAAVAR